MDGSYRHNEKDPAYAWVYRDTPLQVYADFESTTDAEGNQTILICYETDESGDTVVCDEPDCTAEMFRKLDALPVDQDGDDREDSVIFHNLKGYNGMFLLQHCYATHCEVKAHITMGTKILSLNHII